jgi:anti-sigma-K factor RskA
VTCAEFKELAPAWALGSLDEAESQACEAHLATPRFHEGCESTIAQADQAAQVLAWALAPDAPSETAWEAIEEQLGEEADAAMRKASPMPGWSRFAGVLALAASVAVVFLLVGRYFGRAERQTELASMQQQRTKDANDVSLAQTARSHMQTEFEDCRRDLTASGEALELRERALSLLADPNTEVVGLAPQANFNSVGRLILNRPKHKAMVFAKSLAALKNRDYEVWVIRKGEKIPAGLLKVDAGGMAVATISESLLQTDADAFAVTLEAAGGGTVPKGPAVLVGEIKKG